jgi:alkylation response protein AidB-like acyl-CoA dehydrogenase
VKLDLKLTESEEILRKTALDFMQRDAPRQVIQLLQETDEGCTPELWRKAADMGWLGIIIPEEYGGAGGSFTSAGVLYEALGTGPLPGPHFSSSILGSLILLETGTEDQKRRLLPTVARGECVLALALTEAGYGWDAAVQTTAGPRDGGFVVQGVKLFSMDAAGATHLIVAARTEALKRAFVTAIPVLSAYQAGGCQALCDLALGYSRTRLQFGQAIGRFQRVQDLIIDMVTHADAARWATYEALWKLDSQRPAEESARLAKVVSSTSYWETCTLAHQVFSGISYSKEHPVSFHTKASRSLYSYLGDPAYHKRELAKLLLGAGGSICSEGAVHE